MYYSLSQSLGAQSLTSSVPPTGGSATLLIQFEDENGGTLPHRIYSLPVGDEAQPIDLAIADTEHTLTGLDWNTEHTVDIYSFDDPDESIALSVDIWTAPEDAPSGLAATATGENSIELTWTEPASPPASLNAGTGYEIWISLASPISWVLETTVPVGDVSAEITGLSGNTEYTFRMRSVNGNPAPHDDAFSGYTATVNETTDADVTGPTISTLSPADNASSIAIASNLVATFSEDISLVTGGTITIKNLTDVSQTVITIPDAQASVTGAVLTINPTADLTAGKAYAIQISADCVKDASDNFFAGILNDTAWNFGTAAAGFDWTNLEAYWPMDEASGTRADAVGTLDLAESGGTINSGTGIVHGTAADFEYDNTDFLVKATGAEILHDGGPFTLIMWIKPETIVADHGLFTTNNSNTFLAYFNSSTQLRFRVVTTSLIVTHGMSAGSWYMVAFGYDPTGDTQFISINAAAKSTAANTETRSSTADSIVIGKAGALAVEHFDGLMGPVMWFSEAMDISRIEDIYAGGSGVAYP